MPIVALSPNVIKDCEGKTEWGISLNRRVSKTIINETEYSYIDFFKYWYITKEPTHFQQVFELITLNLKTCKPKSRVYKKYLWLAQRFNAYVGDCRQKYKYDWLQKIEIS